jgi:hypothetical protein
MKNLLLGFFALLLLAGCKGQPAPGCEYTGGSADYISRIGCPSDFDYIKGRPLTEKFGAAQSIKIVYSIAGDKIYFTNSARYPFHFDFCVNVLGEQDDLSLFNSRNYSENPKREYILCNLNYYPSQDVYALELMPEDDTKATELFELFKKIAIRTYFKPKIKMLVTSPEMQARFAAVPAVPLIQADEIYKGRKYVSLNKGGTYGYLRKVDISRFDDYKFDKHDIVLLNGLPNQLPVVAGVMTVPFQTPLCHISLLCRNRNTPNSTCRNAWTDTRLAQLENKLVYYEVKADTFLIRTADEAEAIVFWKKTETRNTLHLAMDTSVHALVNLKDISFKDVELVGGKAANFAELLKIKVDKQPIPLPEGSFAIPFYYYYQHLRQNGILVRLDSLLNNPSLLNDATRRDKYLKEIRTAIKAAPLDKDFLNAVISKMKDNGLTYVNYRFRSSTNAEDVKGFNGAGLYESKTGSLTDADKPVEKAIKAVWASLWDERAFAERLYFNIDQHSVAMGILVHRAFGEELSNGVAVTRHLYRDDYPAYTINVQVGEISVVTPPDSVSCDEAILSLGEVTGKNEVEVEYIGRSSLSPDKPVLTNEQVKLLARYLTAIKDHFFYKVEKGIAKDIVSFWNYGMDVEFKIDKFTGNLYIKQARSL